MSLCMQGLSPPFSIGRYIWNTGNDKMSQGDEHFH